MRFNGLDLNLLVALDALLKEQNVSRAAAEMHLSQSAMSNALSRLREYFQDELLVPVGRRHELTPRAEALTGPVRELLVRAETVVAVQPRFEPETSDRVFKLIVSDYVTSLLMPTVLAEAWRQSKAVRFALLPPTADPALMLSRGEVDMLIIPDAFSVSGHPCEEVFQDRFSAVVWSENRDVGDVMTLEHYLAAGHVALEFGPRNHPGLDGWLLQQQGISRRIEVTSSSMLALAKLVIGTTRVATVHSRLAASLAETLPLRVFPLPVEIPPLVEVMQWHRYREQDAGIAWLRAIVRAAVKRWSGSDLVT